MKRVAKISLTLFTAAGLSTMACSDKKTFAGGAPAGVAAKTENAEPEPDPAEEPEDVTPVPVPDSKELFKECSATDVNVFPADLYELETNIPKLPDFSKRESIKKVCLKQIDITTRNFSEGFPGVDNLKEWFGLNFNFNLKIETGGEYEFIVNSDDGSKLYIDGELVIDHDGQHSPSQKNKKIRLEAGSHKVNLQYFQGPAHQIALELMWVPPGGSRSYIPPSLVTRN